jgi:hypothetical protein
VSCFGNLSVGICSTAPSVRLAFATLLEIGFALSLSVAIGVAIAVRAWVIADVERKKKADLAQSLGRIFDEIDYMLSRGLACWGSDQISAAAKIGETIRQRLGHTLRFSAEVSGLLKRLEDAVAGQERQEQICTGLQKSCGGSSLISASASKTAVVNVYGNVESVGGSGGDNQTACGPASATPSHCTCGDGEWRRAGSTAVKLATRLQPLTTHDHVAAARLAMVALKEKWVRQNILDALNAAHSELDHSAPLSPQARIWVDTKAGPSGA